MGLVIGLLFLFKHSLDAMTTSFRKLDSSH